MIFASQASESGENLCGWKNFASKSELAIINLHHDEHDKTTIYGFLERYGKFNLPLQG